MEEKHPFDVAIEAAGFVRSQGKDRIGTAPNTLGSSCIRRGSVRIEVTGAAIFERDHTVTYYMGNHEWTICAVVTDAEDRQKGAARIALQDLIRIARGLGVKKLYLEATPIPKFKPKMKREALIAWYERLAFVKQSPRVLMLDLTAASVPVMESV